MFSETISRAPYFEPRGPLLLPLLRRGLRRRAAVALGELLEALVRQVREGLERRLSEFSENLRLPRRERSFF